MANVAVLCGGRSAERDVSLRGGQAVKKALLARGHQVKVYDPAKDLELLVGEAASLDVAFLVLHGPGGEDGTIQGLLELIGLPYQGAGVLGSALAMDKTLSKMLYQSAGLQVPKAIELRKGGPLLEEAIEKIGFPLIVKPASQGSSIGLSLVYKEEELEDALALAFEHEGRVLLEEYISGLELTVGVLGEEALPVVEIIPGEKYKLFDYEAKYTPGATKEVCPAKIPTYVAKEAQRCALVAHKVLKLCHYSRTDMIYADSKIYVLETNTIPGMTKTSLLPLAARVAGYSFEDLVEKLLYMALSRNQS